MTSASNSMVEKGLYPPFFLSIFHERSLEPGDLGDSKSWVVRSLGRPKILNDPKHWASRSLGRSEALNDLKFWMIPGFGCPEHRIPRTDSLSVPKASGTSMFAAFTASRFRRRSYKLAVAVCRSLPPTCKKGCIETDPARWVPRVLPENPDLHAKRAASEPIRHSPSRRREAIRASRAMSPTHV